MVKVAPLMNKLKQANWLPNKVLVTKYAFLSMAAIYGIEDSQSHVYSMPDSM